jgi:hypothetical protein
MRAKLLGLGIVLSALVGCGDGKPEGTANGQPGQSDLLEPLVMPQKPEKVLSVREAKEKKDGETVVVSGLTPTEKVKPFNAALATFVILAPEDMAREEVRDEFECDDAAVCPTCKELLEQYGVRVELVDGSGVIVPTTLEGFRGLKPGGPITVEGVVKRDGKDKKTVRIVAKRFYPG